MSLEPRVSCVAAVLSSNDFGHALRTSLEVGIFFIAVVIFYVSIMHLEIHCPHIDAQLLKYRWCLYCDQLETRAPRGLRVFLLQLNQ